MLVFWILCSILTVAVIVILARPLASHAAPGVETGGPEPAHLAVYRDQLAEIEADKARGAITADEADAARTEVGRRLLAEAGRLDAAGSGVANEDRRTTKRAIYTIAAAIPLLALTLYLSVGSPGMPSQSAAERTTRDAIANADIEQMIARVQAQLRANPGDGQGWDVIAPVYLRLERFREAADAFQRAIELLGPTQRRLAGLADATVLAANGVVTETARRTYEKMLELEPGRPEARFGLALAKEQDGDLAEAETAYRALLAEAPLDAPWRHLIEERIQAVAARRGGPVAADGIADLPPPERSAAIMKMVEGLEARLKANGQDLDGWQRLLRSWTVLGNKDRAKLALAEARRALAGDAGALGQINAFAKSLGLDS